RKEGQQDAACDAAHLFHDAPLKPFHEHQTYFLLKTPPISSKQTESRDTRLAALEENHNERLHEVRPDRCRLRRVNMIPPDLRRTLLTMRPSNRLTSVIDRSSAGFRDLFSGLSFVVRPVWEEVVQGALPLLSRESVKAGTQA